MRPSSWSRWRASSLRSLISVIHTRPASRCLATRHPSTYWLPMRDRTSKPPPNSGAVRR